MRPITVTDQCFRPLVWVGPHQGKSERLHYCPLGNDATGIDTRCFVWNGPSTAGEGEEWTEIASMRVN